MSPDAGDNWEAFEQRDNWQLVPPIVTGGQIPAIRAQNDPRSFQAGTGASQSIPEQAPEAASLFNVNFMGADQNWYSISARVQRPAHRTATQPAIYVAGQADRAQAQVQYRQPAPPTLAAPTWNGTETAEERMQQKQPLPFPQQASLNPAWSQNFAPDMINPGYQEARSSERPINQTSAQKASPVENEEDQSFVLQIIQPGLVGLMDGSVSTLAPIFAVAFATHLPFTAFIVGMASALGAGISMAFAEGLSDDGDLTGRGSPLVRGGVTGLMTFLSGVGHALPFLVPNLNLALTLAYVVVAVELLAIAGVRYKYFKTKLWLSLVQVVGGGMLVFLVALLLGNA